MANLGKCNTEPAGYEEHVDDPHCLARREARPKDYIYNNDNIHNFIII